MSRWLTCVSFLSNNRDSARYDFNHEILDNSASIFRGEKVTKTRRISVICRSPPTHWCSQRCCKRLVDILDSLICTLLALTRLCVNTMLGCLGGRHKSQHALLAYTQLVLTSKERETSRGRDWWYCCCCWWWWLKLKSGNKKKEEEKRRPVA